MESQRTAKKHMLAILAMAVTVLALTGASAAVESPAGLSSTGSEIRETALGDLVADAFKKAADADVSLVPAGSFRGVTVDKGKVKAEEVIKCLQYPDDKIVLIEITGKQLQDALERSVSIHPQKNLGFLQVSGLEMKFDPKAPKGSRVKSVKIGKEPVDGQRKYKVATTKPLADGAYGYFTIWGKDLKPKLKDTTASDAVNDFLSGRKSVDYRKAHRIIADVEKK